MKRKNENLIRSLKEISNIKAVDRRKMKKFTDPATGKVYTDLTDFFAESFYGENYVDDGSIYGILGLMKK